MFSRTPLLLISAIPLFALQVADAGLATQARKELYAARYEKAIDLYRQLLAATPNADCYYDLTRALLEAHRTKEAYNAAAAALTRSPQTADTQTAAGLATFRKGELVKAESYYRAALKLDPKYAGALSGLADIYAAVSMARSARQWAHRAYLANPDDPSLLHAEANTLQGDQHIAVLEKVLLLLDPETEDARRVRAHIGLDRGLRGRKARRLVSPYEPARLKLTRIMNRPGSVRGVALRVQFNQSYTARLMLDTGASGISLSPKSAAKAGLELLSAESYEAKGIGDKKAQTSSGYLASEIRIGSVIIADHPVSAFQSAKDSDVDGLIGTDVFRKFILTVNYPANQIDLEPYAVAPDEDPVDAKQLAPGFHRVFRAGTHMMLPTFVNDSPAKLFLIDSGASSNLIDTDAARGLTGVHRDDGTIIHGVQGRVDKVSRADRVTLVFAGFRQENPDLIAINLEKTSDALGMAMSGVIGMPVLRQMKMTIDYREGAVKMEAVKGSY